MIYVGYEVEDWSEQTCVCCGRILEDCDMPDVEEHFFELDMSVDEFMKCGVHQFIDQVDPIEHDQVVNWAKNFVHENGFKHIDTEDIPESAETIHIEYGLPYLIGDMVDNVKRNPMVKEWLGYENNKQ